MLPDQLGKLRKQLADKKYIDRTTLEDELLRELNLIDEKGSLNESIRGNEFKSYGSSGKCDCCQRRF
jgi:hypothetical protein